MIWPRAKMTVRLNSTQVKFLLLFTIVNMLHNVTIITYIIIYYQIF
jgi:hypothetical protein